MGIFVKNLLRKAHCHEFNAGLNRSKTAFGRRPEEKGCGGVKVIEKAKKVSLAGRKPNREMMFPLGLKFPRSGAVSPLMTVKLTETEANGGPMGAKPNERKSYN